MRLFVGIICQDVKREEMFVCGVYENAQAAEDAVTGIVSARKNAKPSLLVYGYVQTVKLGDTQTVDVQFKLDNNADYRFVFSTSTPRIKEMAEETPDGGYPKWELVDGKYREKV